VSRLNLSDDLKLPLEWAQMATIVYGGRGAGKTTFGSVAAEEVWKQQVRFCVIDVKGDWWGLKSSADGKAAGIPVVIFGGDHQDVPLDENAGIQVADIVAALEQPVIIDLENLSKGKQIKFLAAFFERLYDVNRNPLLLLLDEIQRYAPQAVRFNTPEMSMCLGAVEDLVKLGRKHGIGVIGFTQRGAGVNKEVSELCDLLMAFRTPGPLDQGRVREWLEANVTLERQKEVMSKIAELDTGTAIIASGHPQLKIFVTAAIRRRETFDSSATPKIGVRRVEPKVLAQPDLEQLAVKMAATIERAKQDDPKELRKAIADLKRQLAQAPKVQEVQKVKEVEKRVEVPVLKDYQVARLESAIHKGRGLVDGIMKAAADITEAVNRAQFAQHQPPALRVSPPPMMSRNTQPPPAPRPVRAELVDSSDFRPGGGSQRILNVLAWLESVGVPQAERTQVAALSDLAPRAGTFSTYLSRLQSAGLIERRGQVLRLTDSGRSTADPMAAPQTTEDLHRQVFQKLGGGMERILRELIALEGVAMTKQNLAERTNLTANAGTFSTYLSRLRSLGFIEVGGGQVWAANVLFLEPVPA
jgi:uncharacterized protein